MRKQLKTCTKTLVLDILEVKGLWLLSFFPNNFVNIICLLYLEESGYCFVSTDPNTKAWLQHHKHLVFGFPTLVRFSWGTCTPYFKDIVEVLWSVPLHFVKKFYHKLFSSSLYVPAHLSSFPISFVSVWSEF